MLEKSILLPVLALLLLHNVDGHLVAPDIHKCRHAMAGSGPLSFLYGYKKGKSRSIMYIYNEVLGIVSNLLILTYINEVLGVHHKICQHIFMNPRM